MFLLNGENAGAASKQFGGQDGMCNSIVSAAAFGVFSHTGIDPLAHPHYEVRLAVAEDAAAPPESLAILAGDQHPDVRYMVAENYSCPVQSLAVLAEDENPYVAQRAHRTLTRLQSNCLVSAALVCSLGSNECQQDEQVLLDRQSKVEPGLDQALSSGTWGLRSSRTIIERFP